MLNVAVTGNVAAGKSTVVRWFREWGATIIDSDALVREAQRPGTETLSAIRQRFGNDVIRPDGTLDRAALRGRVMADDAALQALNAIMHPVVWQRREELAADAAARGDRVLVNDIPLLFEVLDPGAFDVTILVDAPVAVRRKRLMDARGLTHEDADRLIAAQAPADQKRSRSDFVIDNDGSLDELRTHARQVWQSLLDLSSDAA